MLGNTDPCVEVSTASGILVVLHSQTVNFLLVHMASFTLLVEFSRCTFDLRPQDQGLLVLVGDVSLQGEDLGLDTADSLERRADLLLHLHVLPVLVVTVEAMALNLLVEFKESVHHVVVTLLEIVLHGTVGISKLIVLGQRLVSLLD